MKRIICFISLLMVSNVFFVQSETPELINKDSLAFELSQIYGLDQGIRSGNIIRDKASVDVMMRVDSLNMERVMAFIKHYGFPRKELLGEENYSKESVSMAAIAVLLHNPSKVIRPEIYSTLREESLKGHLNPISLGLILDKYYSMEKGYSLYGSQFKNVTPCRGVCIQNKRKVNKARRDIGLESLPDSVFVNCDDDCNKNEIKKEISITISNDI